MWAIPSNKTRSLEVDPCFTSAAISSIGLEPPHHAAVVLSLRDDQAATVAPRPSVRNDFSTSPMTNNPSVRFLGGQKLLLEIAALQRHSTFPSCCISLFDRPKTYQYHQANKHSKGMPIYEAAKFGYSEIQSVHLENGRLDFHYG
ncbi:hypothetical protein CSAL01_10420 [Colletotrichum salicis]|uniref:Uncharacterized protein n=1 Tax=Colletotrichum salicis TaxID=1209931 RepID=A0A135SYI3_9PEZI|nr:hypothetical protein CSAL01_10420 [Colletotrichum salicis]